MYADNVILICPAGHEFFNVRQLERFVKQCFHLVGRPTEIIGLLACFRHGWYWWMKSPFCRVYPDDGQRLRLSARIAIPSAVGTVASMLLIPPIATPFVQMSCNLMEISMKTWILALFAVALTGCGYNDFQRLDEQTASAWSEVLNQYQRRADLVPNIVATVKGEASFEQDTLTKVVEARAKATSIQVTPETLNNPEAFKKFQAAQGELSGALSRLMVVSERYPDLKANRGFSDLRVQLEGTENRITVARNRYIQAVQEYNVLARSFPSNLTAMAFSYQPKPAFAVQNEATIAVPPVVDFNKK